MKGEVVHRCLCVLFQIGENVEVLVVVGDGEIVAVFVPGADHLIGIFGVAAGCAVHGDQIFRCVHCAVRMGDLLCSVGLVEAVVCGLDIAVICGHGEAAQIVCTEGGIPNAAVGELNGAEAHLSQLVVAGGELEVYIPLAGLHGSGQLQVKLRRNCGAGVPRSGVRIHFCFEVVPVLFQNDLGFLCRDGIGKPGVFHFGGNAQHAVLRNRSAQIGIPQDEAVAEVIPNELKDGLSVVGAVVYALHIVCLAEGVVLVQAVDVGVDIAQVGVVHLRHGVFRQVGVILLGKVQIAGELAAVVRGERLLPQPFQVTCPVVERAEVGVRAHIAIIIKTDTGCLTAGFQNIIAQIRFLDASPLGEDVGGTHGDGDAVRYDIQH